MIMLGGGGYNPLSVARCWTNFVAIAAQVSLTTDIPEHKYMMLYKPTFSLHTKAGTKTNLNDSSYISKLMNKIRLYFKQAKIKNPINIQW